MKTLYVADLDGTLFSDGAVLTSKTLEILNMLIDKGMLFSIATARSVATVGNLLKDLKLNLPVSLMNGVFCTDIYTRKVLKYNPIDKNAFNEALEIFDSKQLYPFLYLFKDGELEVQYSKLHNIASTEFFEARSTLYYKKFEQVERLHIPESSEPVYFNTLADQNVLCPLYDVFQGIDSLSSTIYSDSYSDYCFFEVFSKDAGKGSGALHLKSIAGADRLVVFGDNNNDLSMFKVADESYAMGNGVDNVKKAATAVIGRNTEDGIANFLLSRYDEQGYI